MSDLLPLLNLHVFQEHTCELNHEHNEMIWHKLASNNAYPVHLHVAFENTKHVEQNKNEAPAPPSTNPINANVRAVFHDSSIKPSVSSTG